MGTDGAVRHVDRVSAVKSRPRAPARRRPNQEIAKRPTGIAGFDQITRGGLPQGRTTLVCGGAGCGKTLFAIEFLVNGAIQHGEPGVFIAFEETEEELTRNVASLGFDLAALVDQKLLAIDFIKVDRAEIEEAGEYDLEGLFGRLAHAVVYSNARFAELVGVRLDHVIGTKLQHHIAAISQPLLDALLETRHGAPSKTEIQLAGSDGSRKPAYVSVAPAWDEDLGLTCVIVTDLTDQKRDQDMLAAEGLTAQIVEQADRAGQGPARSQAGRARARDREEHRGSGGPGQGSEFEVRLPALTTDHDLGERRKTPAPGSRDALRDKRVLVVDDNVDAADLLSHALEGLGYETRTAYDGPSALEAAAAFDPDIALLDIGLPAMDGYELARRLRRRRQAAAPDRAHRLRPRDRSNADPRRRLRPSHGQADRHRRPGHRAPQPLRSAGRRAGLTAPSARGVPIRSPGRTVRTSWYAGRAGR